MRCAAMADRSRSSRESSRSWARARSSVQCSLGPSRRHGQRTTSAGPNEHGARPLNPFHRCMPPQLALSRGGATVISRVRRFVHGCLPVVRWLAGGAGANMSGSTRVRTSGESSGARRPILPHRPAHDDDVAALRGGDAAHQRAPRRRLRLLQAVRRLLAARAVLWVPPVCAGLVRGWSPGMPGPMRASTAVFVAARDRPLVRIARSVRRRRCRKVWCFLGSVFPDCEFVCKNACSIVHSNASGPYSVSLS